MTNPSGPSDNFNSNYVSGGYFLGGRCALRRVGGLIVGGVGLSSRYDYILNSKEDVKLRDRKKIIRAQNQISKNQILEYTIGPQNLTLGSNTLGNNSRTAMGVFVWTRLLLPRIMASTMPMSRLN